MKKRMIRLMIQCGMLMLASVTAFGDGDPVQDISKNPKWAMRKTPSKNPFRVVAYDSSRSRVVFFGGDETWEWDGTDWSKITPANTPLARSFHAIAYDSSRGKVVLFGGKTSGGYSSETWEWDGSNWSKKTPGNSPSARSGHAMTYDSTRGKVVLFGGLTSDLRDNNETWEWDGTNWSKKTPTNIPLARRFHAMAYDSSRGRVVLYGGANGTGRKRSSSDKTWEWDGANWTLIKSANKPSARESHAMAFDFTRGKVVLFGGILDGGGYCNETWEWDGTNWTQKTLAINPRASDSGMVYDSAHSKIVLFNEAGETWEYGVD